MNFSGSTEFWLILSVIINILLGILNLIENTKKIDINKSMVNFGTTASSPVIELEMELEANKGSKEECALHAFQRCDNLSASVYAQDNGTYIVRIKTPK